jgi:hypothetical protein
MRHECVQKRHENPCARVGDLSKRHECVIKRHEGPCVSIGNMQKRHECVMKRHNPDDQKAPTNGVTSS